MTTDILKEIDQKNDLHIAPYKSDGKTTGTPTWIWEVLVNGNLYVRAYNGKTSRWYQSALAQKAGIIKAAGKSFKVDFQAIVDPALLSKIDEAYEYKYASSPYLYPMVSPRTKAATVLITLKEEI
ncbi:hypothetical protein SAMN05216474_0732 [Lishizhenia tianjinensis]|uniref:DUF2255 family protein n=1 Tax=Lishizhenia tianjinensis TaxID=477690 RepID=A0A1I6Y8T8_9FLAO|nr:DUF2255 family protein [Lishizhenia tianjinensis]SFT46945.1 hypothetical protein SAMN05216474_0732 [Lishizhenia tianjinensis]